MMKYTQEKADLLFNDDGSVRLPKMIGVAIRLASQGRGCLTRQPTRERAEAVMEAARERVESLGFTMELRPGKTTPTWAVYVLPNARDAAVA